jgi:hypothetical protein
MHKPLVSLALFVIGEYSFLCVPATQGSGRGTMRLLRYWTMMVRLAHQGMALALGLLVLLSVASPVSALCTVQRQRPASRVPLLFVLSPEDQTDQDRHLASCWPGVPALVNVSNELEHPLPARRWCSGRATHVRTREGVSPYPERAPPA